MITHNRAVAMMVATTLLWSIAGVVTRHLEAARAFEVTFWRSASNAVALVVLLSWLRGPGGLWRSLRQGGRALWISGACWCVMYTNFMIALTLTTVANVLITMALAPVFTALASRVALKHRLPVRAWAAIGVAAAGIGWMFGSQVAGGESRHLWGTLVALGVPLAAATNWTLLQHQAARATRVGRVGNAATLGQATNPVKPGGVGHTVGGAAEAAPEAGPSSDMLGAVLLGAIGSAVITLPLALPLQASLHDVSLLGFLGLFQLAIPCLMAVTAARTLKAPEAALLSLLEVVFGVAWAWWGAGESPSVAVLGGGTLVLLALAANEALALRERRGAAVAAGSPA